MSNSNIITLIIAVLAILIGAGIIAFSTKVYKNLRKYLKEKRKRNLRLKNAICNDNSLDITLFFYIANKKKEGERLSKLEKRFYEKNKEIEDYAR
jgi:hypothetical protein